MPEPRPSFYRKQTSHAMPSMWPWQYEQHSRPQPPHHQRPSRASYRNRQPQPPSKPSADPKTLDTLRVIVRIEQEWTHPPEVILASWTGMGKDVILFSAAKRYIITELAKALKYEEQHGKLFRRHGDAFSMKFRITEKDWNGNMNRLTVNEVQPLVKTLRMAKRR